MITEEQYQFGLRELPPVKLIKIINEYRKQIEYMNDLLYSKCDEYFWSDRQKTREEIYNLRKIIPEWYNRKLTK